MGSFHLKKEVSNFCHIDKHSTFKYINSELLLYNIYNMVEYFSKL